MQNHTPILKYTSAQPHSYVGQTESPGSYTISEEQGSVMFLNAQEASGTQD